MRTVWKSPKTVRKSPKKVRKWSEDGMICSKINLIKTNDDKQYICRYCSKIYNNKNSKWSHEQKCKLIHNNKKELELLVEKEKKEILKKEEKILKLKLKLEKSNNIDNVTLNQINKKLLERNNLIKNSNINSIVNSNNKTQNNIFNQFQLIGFTKEDVVELLTMQEKKQIMNSKFCCLEKLVEIIHCGKYNQFKNIIITNMNNNYMYKYDDEKGQFMLSTKSSVLNSLIDCRVSDIEIIYNELIDNNKLDDKTKDLVEKFINKINDNNEKFIDIDNKEYESYKHYKINEIKIILYNNKDKITNDISLMLITTKD